MLGAIFVVHMPRDRKCREAFHIAKARSSRHLHLWATTSPVLRFCCLMNLKQSQCKFLPSV